MDDVAGKPRTYPEPLPANARRILIPAAAMAQWLADIDDIGELKVTLRALALLAELSPRGSVPPSIPLHELLDDSFLEAGMDETAIRQGLASAIARSTLLAVRSAGEVRVFLNDENCRRYVKTAGVTELTASDLIGPAGADAPKPLPQSPTTGEPRANIFALYEQHIGPYGHSMAEQLKAAEEEYPASWIEYAFSLASRHNAYSWSYVHSILQRLVHEGLPEHTVTENEHGKSWNDPEANRRAEFLDSYRRRHGNLPGDPGSGTEPTPKH